MAVPVIACVLPTGAGVVVFSVMWLGFGLMSATLRRIDVPRHR